MFVKLCSLRKIAASFSRCKVEVFFFEKTDCYNCLSETPVNVLVNHSLLENKVYVNLFTADSKSSCRDGKVNLHADSLNAISHRCVIIAPNVSDEIIRQQ